MTQDELNELPVGTICYAINASWTISIPGIAWRLDEVTIREEHYPNGDIFHVPIMIDG